MARNRPRRASLPPSGKMRSGGCKVRWSLHFRRRHTKRRQVRVLVFSPIANAISTGYRDLLGSKKLGGHPSRELTRRPAVQSYVAPRLQGSPAWLPNEFIKRPRAEANDERPAGHNEKRAKTQPCCGQKTESDDRRIDPSLRYPMTPRTNAVILFRCSSAECTRSSHLQHLPIVRSFRELSSNYLQQNFLPSSSLANMRRSWGISVDNLNKRFSNCLPRAAQPASIRRCAAQE